MVIFNKTFPEQNVSALIFFFFVCFWWTSGSFFVIFSSVAPHRGQPAAMCHPRWQPTRRLADSCGLGRRRIRPGTAGQQSGPLPMSYHASTPMSYHASTTNELPRLHTNELPRLHLSYHTSTWATTPPRELPRLHMSYHASTLRTNGHL